MRICIGFQETEGKCDQRAGTPWTKLWCPACDQRRRDHITKQLEELVYSTSGRQALPRPPQAPTSV